MADDRTAYISEYIDISNVSNTETVYTFRGLINTIITSSKGNLILTIFDPSSMSDIKSIQSKKLLVYFGQALQQSFFTDLSKIYDIGRENKTHEIFANSMLIFVNIRCNVRNATSINFLNAVSFDLLSIPDYLHLANSSHRSESNTVYKSINTLTEWDKDPKVPFNFSSLQNSASERELLLKFNSVSVQKIAEKYIKNLKDDTDSDSDDSSNEDLKKSSNIIEDPKEALTVSESSISSNNIDNPKSLRNPEKLGSKNNDVPPKIELSPPSSPQDNYSPSPSPNKGKFNNDDSDSASSPEDEDFFGAHGIQLNNDEYADASENTIEENVVSLKPLSQKHISNINLGFDDSDKVSDRSANENIKRPLEDSSAEQMDPAPKKSKRVASSDDSVHFYDAQEVLQKHGKKKEPTLFVEETSDSSNEIQEEALIQTQHHQKKFFDASNDEEDLNRSGSSNKDENLEAFNNVDGDHVESSGEANDKIVPSNFKVLKDKTSLSHFSYKTQKNVIGSSDYLALGNNIFETQQSDSPSRSQIQSHFSSKATSYSEAIKEPIVMHTGVQTNINYMTMELIWRKTHEILFDTTSAPYISNPSHSTMISKRSNPLTPAKHKTQRIPNIQSSKKKSKIQGALTSDAGRAHRLTNIIPILAVDDDEAEEIMEDGMAIGSSPAKPRLGTDEDEEIEDNAMFVDDFLEESEEIPSGEENKNTNEDIVLVEEQKSNIKLPTNDSGSDSELEGEAIDYNVKIIKNRQKEEHGCKKGGADSKIHRLVKGVGNFISINCNVIGILPLTPEIPLGKHCSFALQVVEAADYKRCLKNNKDLQNFIVDLQVSNTTILAKRLGLAAGEDLFKKVYKLLAIGSDREVVLNIRRQKDDTLQWFYKNKFDDSVKDEPMKEQQRASIQLSKSSTIADLNYENFGKHDLYVNLVALRIKKEGTGGRLLVTDFLDFSTSEIIIIPPVTTLSGNDLTTVREVFVKDSYVFSKIIDEVNKITGLNVDKQLSNGGIDSRFFTDYPLLNYGIMIKLSGWTKDFRGSIDLNLNSIIFLKRDKIIDGPPEEIQKLKALYKRYDGYTNQEFLRENFSNLAVFLPYLMDDKGHVVFEDNDKTSEKTNYQFFKDQMVKPEFEEFSKDTEVFEVESLSDLNDKLDNEFVIYKVNQVKITDIKYYSEKCLKLSLEKNDETASIYLLQEKNVDLMFLQNKGIKKSHSPVFDNLQRVEYPLSLDSPIFVISRIAAFKKKGIHLKTWEMVGFDELWVNENN